jgi:hypothetical protein
VQQAGKLGNIPSLRRVKNRQSHIFFLLETLEKRFQLTYNYLKRQSLDINEIRDDRAVTFRDDSLQYDPSA